MNPEAWVLDPANWGFVMDVWGGVDVEDFEASPQKFPISAHGLPVDEVSFSMDTEEAPPPAQTEPTAIWDFDPDHWGFATGWMDRTLGDG